MYIYNPLLTTYFNTYFPIHYTFSFSIRCTLSAPQSSHLHCGSGHASSYNCTSSSYSIMNDMRLVRTHESSHTFVPPQLEQAHADIRQLWPCVHACHEQGHAG